MDAPNVILFDELHFLDLGLPRRRPRADPMAVVTEGLKELEKSPGQLADEILTEIDSLHEPTFANQTSAPFFNSFDVICVECWTKWPCGTHKTIYGEDNTTCVHSYRPGASTGMV